MRVDKNQTLDTCAGGRLGEDVKHLHRDEVIPTSQAQIMVNPTNVIRRRFDIQDEPAATLRISAIFRLR